MKLASAIASVCLVACAVAQRPAAPASIRVPQILDRGHAYDITPYTDRPADLTLITKGEGARHGQIWLQNVGDGLLVVGEVDGERPDFPRHQNLILEKDHVEIWLADGKDPELPPIGWGNQFDQVTLPNGADSCSEWARKVDTPAAPTASTAEKRCRTWAETQVPYRTYFRRLFVRQWLVAPDVSFESFATPAYDQIATRFSRDRSGTSQPDGAEVPLSLEPKDLPQAWFGPGKDHSGYTFEILIPFRAFPPLSSTELRELRLMVDVFNPAPPGKKVGAFSTSSASRIYARPDTFNRLALDPPRQFHLTPCDLPLAGDDKYKEAHPAWFIPQTTPDSEYESDAFIIVNDGAGYQYEPEVLSPVARRIQYFWQGIGGGEYICGPDLSYRRGETKLNLNVNVDEDGFDARRLPGGDLLIKVGPRVYGSEFGSGQCGACPRTDLRIFRLGADRQLQPMLQLGDIVDNGSGASQDFSLSRDWSKVVEYDQAVMDGQGKSGAWSATTWCRGEVAYHQCDHQDSAEPPDPPVLKELRNAD